MRLLGTRKAAIEMRIQKEHRTVLLNPRLGLPGQ
jgi:hypothetical protein